MKQRIFAVALSWLLVALALTLAHAQDRSTWTQPQAPVKIFGNSYWVGTRGLGAILITSPSGAVLIDGAVRESAADIAKNITTVGVRLSDVKLILNTHAHNDHAGSLAELQRLTGATVAALPWSAEVLRSGQKDRKDPQFDTNTPPSEKVATVKTIKDGEALQAGGVTVKAHKTGGHTPGGTSWTWRSCEDGRCVDIVYADSMTAVSADSFRFTDAKTYPEVLDDFAKGVAFLRAVSCDILVTPHPEASDFWARAAKRDAGERDALIDRTQCARYADRIDAQLQKRLASERAK